MKKHCIVAVIFTAFFGMPTGTIFANNGIKVLLDSQVSSPSFNIYNESGDTIILEAITIAPHGRMESNRALVFTGQTGKYYSVGETGAIIASRTSLLPAESQNISLSFSKTFSEATGDIRLKLWNKRTGEVIIVSCFNCD